MTKLPEHLMIGGQEETGPLIDTRKDYVTVRKNYRYTHRNIETVADLKATLRAGPYAWPGGYPLYFITSNGGALSFETVRAEFHNVIDSIHNKMADGWQVVACDINYEDYDLVDDHTGELIECAYSPGVVNLDGMDIEDVRAYSRDKGNPESLRDYAAMKVLAMESRLEGKIPAALDFESACGNIYNRLPPALKW